MPLIINGQKGVHLQPAKYGRTESGWYCELTWIGTKEAVQTIVPFCMGARAIFHVEESPSGAATKLVARFATSVSSGGVGVSTPESPEDNWQYFANMIEKSVLECDLANVDPPLTNDEINLIKTNLDHLDAIDLGDDPRDDVVELFNLMKSGVTSIRVLQPILRHTQTVSQLWTTKTSTANAGKILTTNALIRLEGVPALLIDLPALSSTKPGLAYGWFKHFPSIKISALQKVQVEQEWEYGLWAGLLYQFVA